MFSSKYLKKSSEKEFYSELTNNKADNEWDELYEFQKNYIIENKICSRELLHFLCVPVTMCIYIDNKAFYPSSDENTNGLKLRTKLKSLREENIQIVWNDINNVTPRIAFERFLVYFNEHIKYKLDKKYSFNCINSVLNSKEKLEFIGYDASNKTIQSEIIRYFLIFCENNELKNKKIEFCETEFL